MTRLTQDGRPWTTSQRKDSVLMVLDRGGWWTSSAIEKWLSWSPSTVPSVLQALEKQGAVKARYRSSRPNVQEYHVIRDYVEVRLRGAIIRITGTMRSATIDNDMVETTPDTSAHRTYDIGLATVTARIDRSDRNKVTKRR